MSDRRWNSSRGEAGGTPEADPRRGVAWIIVAVGLLAAGLVTGTLAYALRSPWAVALPPIAFVAYVLSFRRGLRLWNPRIDATWRQYLWLERDARDGRPETPEGRYPVPSEEPRPPRHEMRVVR